MYLFLPPRCLFFRLERCGRRPTQARAQVLQLETQVIGRLDDLLKRCGKDPGSAQAISNWLCAEGLEGHAKKGLSRILWCVRRSRTLVLPCATTQQPTCTNFTRHRKCVTLFLRQEGSVRMKRCRLTYARRVQGRTARKLSNMLVLPAVEAGRNLCSWPYRSGARFVKARMEGEHLLLSFMYDAFYSERPILSSRSKGKLAPCRCAVSSRFVFPRWAFTRRGCFHFPCGHPSPDDPYVACWTVSTVPPPLSLLLRDRHPRRGSAVPAT